MNIIYHGHRVHAMDTFEDTPDQPGGGMILDTGERVKWSSRNYNRAPTEEDWLAAHRPVFVPIGPRRARCSVCGRLRA
jgi:hypothetical protein